MAPDDAQPPRRTRDPEGTKVLLLQAAGRRFLFQGYDRTTTRDIAQDAGVNISLISRYFGGKRGLYRAVIAAITELLETDEDNPPHPDGALAGFLDSLDPEQWPDVGGHPLQLLLQDPGDEEDRELRAITLRAVVRKYILRGEPQNPGHELRGDLVFALFCGIVMLRDVGTLGPLATASAGDLTRELDAVVRQMLDPDGVGRRSGEDGSLVNRPPPA